MASQTQPTSGGGVVKSPHEALREDLLKSRRRTSSVNANLFVGLPAPITLKRRLEDQPSAVHSPTSQPRPPKRHESGASAEADVKTVHAAEKIKLKKKIGGTNQGRTKSKAVDRVREKGKRLGKSSLKKGNMKDEKNAGQPSGVSGAAIRAPGVLSKVCRLVSTTCDWFGPETGLNSAPTLSDAHARCGRGCKGVNSEC